MTLQSEKLKKELKNLLDNSPKPLYISFNGTKYKPDSEELELLFAKCESSPLLNDNFRIGISTDRTMISGMSSSRFPDCCGKMIFSAFFLSACYYEGFKSIYFTDDFKLQLFNFNLSLCCEFARSMRFTSVCFILSETEQPNLVKIMESLPEYKIINEFNNQRMKLKNKCYEYCINLF